MSRLEKLKSNYAAAFMSNLAELRRSGWKSDFRIKAGNKTFLAHRIVLSSFSLLLKHMMEIDEAEDILLPISEAAAEQLVRFMYSGDAVVNEGNCEDLLLMADRFDSRELRSRCSLYLDDITPQNCFHIHHLSKTHHFHEKVQAVENFIRKNFFSIRTTIAFRSLSKEELIKCLLAIDLNPLEIWDAGVSWVKYDRQERQTYVTELLSCFVKRFPVIFMIEHILPNSIVASSPSCKRLLESEILSRLGDARSAITEKTFLFFQKLSEDCEHENSRDIQGLVTAFILQKFPLLSKMEAIKEISMENLKRLFVSPEAVNISSKDKWEFLVKWTKHDTFHREEKFPDLFSLIDLSKLPGHFIREVVCKETLVTKSETCNNLVKDAIFHLWKEGSSEAETPPTKKKKSSVASSSREKDRKISSSMDESYHVAVYRRDSGNVVGINLDTRERRKVAGTKVASNPFQTIAEIGEKMYLMKGSVLKSFSVQEDGKKQWAKCKQLRREPGRTAKMFAFKRSLYIFEEFKKQGDCNFARYDDETDSWTENEIPTVTGSGFCVSSDGCHIFLVGGDRAPRRTLRHNTLLHFTVEMVGDTIYPRTDSAAASLRGEIYVLGGSDCSKTSQSMEFCNPQFPRAHWTLIRSKMQSPRWNFAACVHENNIFAVGGKKKSGDSKDAIEVYNKLTKGEWTVFCKITKIEAPISAAVIKLPASKSSSQGKDATKPKELWPGLGDFSWLNN